jgi:hypothetical protein
VVISDDVGRKEAQSPNGEKQNMDSIYDLHSWSKQRREEALEEAQRRSLTERAKRNRGTRFEPGRVVSVLSGVLSLLR